MSTEHPIYLDGETCKFEFADILHLGHPPFWLKKFGIIWFPLGIIVMYGVVTSRGSVHLFVLIYPFNFMLNIWYFEHKTLTKRSQSITFSCGWINMIWIGWIMKMALICKHRAHLWDNNKFANNYDGNYNYSQLSISRSCLDYLFHKFKLLEVQINLHFG